MTRRRMFSSLAAVALLAGTCGLVLQFAGSAYAANPPSFTTYAAPPSVGGADAGEPSVGVPRAGTVMYQAGLQTLRITGAETGTASWSDVSPLATSLVSLDPILFSDQATGRTFVSQLTGACSLMAFSDDAGASWVQNPIGCGAGTAVDHQTVGGGTYAAPLTGGTPVYEDATYYCAQAIAGALCARSDDGGVTFGPGVPMYTALSCGGLHGHLKTGPDGTIYVPNADCGGQQGVAYSTDNGTTWKISTVPDSSTQDESDPSVAIGKDGRIYFSYDSNEGTKGAISRPRVAVGTKSAAGVITWSPSITVDSSIQNTQFPAAVAGDAGRAAVAYVGTTTSGDDQASSFPGVWHLYVSTTYDGGSSWTTSDVTGSDPVQRGCIWLGGGDNTCRNLLDFNDATLDPTGHIVVAYADGCTTTCVTGGKNTYSALASLAYQTGGDPLIGAGTSTSTSTTASTTTTTAGSTTLGAPTLSGRTAPGKQAGTKLSWTVPSSPETITGYDILRGTSSGGEVVVASVSGSTTAYSDTQTTRGTTYYYEVRAATATRTGPPSNEVAIRAG